MGVDPEKLKIPLAPVVFPGGETSALSRMEKHCSRTNWVAKFEKPQTSPNALEPATTVGIDSSVIYCISWIISSMINGG